MSSATSTSSQAPARVVSAVYSAEDLAALLDISKRQVWRLRDSGSLPNHIRIGQAVRWSRVVVDQWIAAGCPRPKQQKV
ncbi:MAG: helix-turn-helix transcriptional regulator [Isosphaeraceae bacterium]